MTKQKKDAIFINNQKLIRNTARKALADFRLKSIELDDVVQDTYLKWTLSPYSDGKVKPLDYIINLIYQILIDQQRKLVKKVDLTGIDRPDELPYIDKLTTDKVFEIQEQYFKDAAKNFNSSEERNLAITKLIREGYNNKDIAAKLDISEMAVKNFKTKFVKRAKQNL